MDTHLDLHVGEEQSDELPCVLLYTLLRPKTQVFSVSRKLPMDQ